MNISPFSPGDKVVAYCRYSAGDEQGRRNTSTEEQAAAIASFCSASGLELVQTFADPFVSGRSVAGRDHYLEMLSFLLRKKKPDIQGVILWDYERYGRNYDQAAMDAARLRMAGYKLFSMQQPINDDGPFARVLESMYFASAQNQSDMISADVKRALHTNFEKYKVIPRSCIPTGWIAVPVDMGFYSDGRPRVGYRCEPDPKAAPVIRDLISRRMAGASFPELIPYSGGIFTRPNAIRVMMARPVLYGSFSYGGITIEDYCAPVISREEWDRLQAFNLSQPRKIRKPGAGAWSHDRALLSGLAVCGVCCRPVYIDRRTAKGRLYETYYCDGKHAGMRRAEADALVLSAAVDLLSGDRYEADKAAIMAAVAVSPTDGPNASEIMAEITAIDKKTESITDAIAEAGSSRALLLKLRALEDQRAALESQLDAISDGRPADALETFTEELRGYCLSVLLNEKNDVDLLRVVLSFFIQRVIFFPNGQICIRHTLPGLLPVGSESSGKESAPPEGAPVHSQLLNDWFSLSG